MGCSSSNNKTGQVEETEQEPEFYKRKTKLQMLQESKGSKTPKEKDPELLAEAEKKLSQTEKDKKAKETVGVPQQFVASTSVRRAGGSFSQKSPGPSPSAGSLNSHRGSAIASLRGEGLLGTDNPLSPTASTPSAPHSPGLSPRPLPILEEEGKKKKRQSKSGRSSTRSTPTPDSASPQVEPRRGHLNTSRRNTQTPSGLGTSSSSASSASRPATSTRPATNSKRKTKDGDAPSTLNNNVVELNVARQALSRPTTQSKPPLNQQVSMTKDQKELLNLLREMNEKTDAKIAEMERKKRLTGTKVLFPVVPTDQSKPDLASSPTIANNPHPLAASTISSSPYNSPTQQSHSLLGSPLSNKEVNAHRQSVIEQHHNIMNNLQATLDSLEDERKHLTPSKVSISPMPRDLEPNDPIHPDDTPAEGELEVEEM